MRSLANIPLYVFNGKVRISSPHSTKLPDMFPVFFGTGTLAIIHWTPNHDNKMSRK